MSESFTGKTAIVTGAGGGLGSAVAIGLAKGGASIFLVDRDAAAVAETERKIKDLGGEATSHVVELDGQETCAAVVEAAVAAFGKLDILVNNAAILRFSKAPDITSEHWEKTFAVNVHAPFYLCQASLPHLLESEGAIVNVCSVASFIGEAYLAPYAASKSALLSLTKSLAMEYLRSPVRINAVAPGGMNTGMGRDVAFPEGLDTDLIMRFSGLTQPSEPEEMAEVVLFLASERASSVRGACFVVDRGLLAG